MVRCLYVLLLMLLTALGCQKPGEGNHVADAVGGGSGTAAGGLESPVVDSPRSFQNSIGMTMRPVPPGTFEMGVPPAAWPEETTEEAFREIQAPRQVMLEEAFYVSTTEVTNGQYRTFARATSYANFGSSSLTTGPFAGDRKPVSSVSWEDAQAFCTWLTMVEERRYQLPEEAQWEYACRASSTALFSFGDDPAELGVYAWYEKNSGGHPHEVARLKPNNWGLYDMHGNVWEWCQDLVPDDILRRGDAPEDMFGRRIAFIRGGAYFNSAQSCWAGARWACFPVTTRDECIGFRVVCGAQARRPPGVGEIRRNQTEDGASG